MTVPTLVPGTRDDIRRVADIVAVGFDLLPVSCWLVPDVGRRIATMASYFAILVEQAIEHGHVDRLEDNSGVAVWIHNDPEAAPPPPHYEQRVRRACGEFTDRFLALDAVLAQHHPTGMGHHHLALLSVVPGWQGRGRGTVLLRHHLARLDFLGVPAYLEASSEASRKLYQRHGFGSSEPFHAPQDQGCFWPMWREPRTAAD